MEKDSHRKPITSAREIKSTMVEVQGVVPPKRYGSNMRNEKREKIKTKRTQSTFNELMASDGKIKSLIEKFQTTL